MPNISYAIMTHNEGECIEKLLSFILENKQESDEIVVVDDYSTDPVTKAILEEHESMNHINLFKRELNKDFAWTWFAPSTHGTSSVEFYFVDERYVTFYGLKWS